MRRRQRLWQLVPPPRSPRTPTEAFRDALYERRARTRAEDRVVRLPFVGLEAYGRGRPPAGTTIRTPGEEPLEDDAA